MAIRRVTLSRISTVMFTVSPLPENLGKFSADAIGLKLLFDTKSYPQI